MSTLRQLLGCFLLIGLSLNPAYSYAMTPTNEAVVAHAAHLAASRPTAHQQADCHPQSSQHREHSSSCCKTGQCDCSHAGAIALSLVSTTDSYPAARGATGFSSGPHSASRFRFFRPPIG